jgi:hypothetical protein
MASRQGLARQSSFHQSGKEVREGCDILADTRFFETGYGNDRPRVSAPRHHRVHQEAPAAAAIHIKDGYRRK